MTQKDIALLKKLLSENYLTNDFVYVEKVQRDENKTNDYRIVRFYYHNYILTVADGMGFAYLISWWCVGEMSSSISKAISDVCYKYNARF